LTATDSETNNSKSNKAAHAKSKAGTKLFCEVDQGKFLLELYQKALLLSEKELNDYFLDHAVSLTGSTIGFFHFVSDDQKTIILTAWNGEALKSCRANYTDHYPIEVAGNWVDSLRFKKPVIYNNFAKSPNQKGCPSGHVLIKRFMSIPIIEGNKVKIVFGVGNKKDPYMEDDVVQLQLIANELAKIYRQRQVENTLRESEKKYRSLFENMLSGFAFCKMVYNEQSTPVDFVCLEVNDAFERTMGLKKDNVIGKRVTEVLPGIEKSSIRLLEICGDVAVTGKERKFETFSKLLNRWFSVSIYCPQKGYFAALLENITERKETEKKLEEYQKNLEKLVEERTKQLKDSERLAAIGATAGMVGHDIRNPLQAITGDVYLAKTELVSTSESEEKKNALESLLEIEKNIDYINKIVADLQDFARPLKPYSEEIDLKKLISSLLEKISLPENVKVTVKIDAEATIVVGDCAYLNRIMNNLIVNAVQAMPNGGKLRIEASKDGKNVVLDVVDTGVGVPEEVKNKLFTPMFTTKSKGQGFGLSVVKRMTEALGGTVTFESQEGKGTTFTVRLPFKAKGK
jgi:PAS domain S-box-containing protein